MKTETAAENLKLLQKGSGRLYLLCVIVGALTGFTVSLYISIIFIFCSLFLLKSLILFKFLFFILFIFFELIYYIF